MNVKTFGLWLFLLGFLGALGTGIGYVSLGGQAQRASVESTLTFGSIASRNWSMQAREIERTQERLIPWMIGSGVMAVIGIGLCFAGGGPSGPMRTCPHCAETVLVAAVVCKHCGSKLTPQRSDVRAGSSYRALAKAAEEAERRAFKS